jgi:thymidylate synthase
MSKNIEKQYLKLLKDILDNGTHKQTRNGETLSVFGRQIRHDMSKGFPLLTTKKMAWKQIVTELLWFLRGDTNIKFLVNNDCHIWDGDAFKNYINKTNEYKGDWPDTMDEFIEQIKTDDEFAKKWGELGPVYGKQWRAWGVPRMESKGFDFDAAWEKSQKIWKSSNGMECGPSFETFCMSLLRSKEMGVAYGYHTQTDQITNLINDLKTNPDSRRLMVNAWNVGELDSMVLPPCHFSFQCYSHEKEGKRYLSLAWNQRSCDVGLGIPFNIASYGLLLEIIAKEVGMIPYELIGNLGDCHIYNNHISGLKEQLTREPHMLPKICLDYREGEYNKDLTDLTPDDFVIFDYQSHLPIKLPLSN